MVGTGLRPLAHPTDAGSLFPERTARRVPDIAAPVRWQKFPRDVSVKRTMRPIAGAGHQAVFHRIVVNVIDVTCEIGIATDRVFPITALPYSLFAFGALARVSVRIAGQAAGEIAFDDTPASGKISVVRWQRPNG